MKKTILLLVLIVALGLSASAQKKSPVLFSYGNKSVQTDEFLRMYTKNLNNKKPDFSKKALNDYLDLYSLFKMKVAEAEEMKLDTLKSIRQELGSYRQQLASSYLTNREVTKGLVKEAYQRKLKDVKVSHIMISVKPNSDDTMRQFKQIDSIYRAIKSRKISFANAAKKFSADKQSAVNGGTIGWVTALQVVYPFETAAYETPKGQLSKPFRTIYGYHIIKKEDERKARGQIQVAQIMTLVRKSEGKAGLKKAKAKIDSAYAALRKGENFEDVAVRFNEDEFTKNTGGVMQVFGVGKMVPNYEDAAFALKKRGDYSKVIQTDNGFHIISLMKKIPIKSFEDDKRVLRKLVERDGRIKIAQEEFLNDLKRRMGYQENPTALNALIKAIPDSNLRNGKFNPDNYKRMTKTLFTLDEEVQMNQSDFANYIKKYTKGRIYGPKENSMRSLFKNYTQKVLLDKEEQSMKETNPEYRNLLQEYREGILIFELTDRKVWGKAPKDTVGIMAYFNANRDKYTWAPAVKGKIYKTKDEAFMKNLLKVLNGTKKMTTLEIVKAVNGDGPQDKVSVEERKFEQKQFSFKTPFREGKYMPYYKNKDGSYSLLVVDEVYNKNTQKSFEEARGYVISDYQNVLEKKWHQELKAKYPVQVNQKVFRSIIK